MCHFRRAALWPLRPAARSPEAEAWSVGPGARAAPPVGRLGLLRAPATKRQVGKCLPRPPLYWPLPEPAWPEPAAPPTCVPLIAQGFWKASL